MIKNYCTKILSLKLTIYAEI